MFKAICVGAKQTPNGLEVAAEITTDEDRLVDRVVITGKDMDEIKQRAQNLLAARIRAEQDATLQAQVGQLLASI